MKEEEAEVEEGASGAGAEAGSVTGVAAEADSDVEEVDSVAGAGAGPVLVIGAAAEADSIVAEGDSVAGEDVAEDLDEDRNEMIPSSLFTGKAPLLPLVSQLFPHIWHCKMEMDADRLGRPLK